MPSDPAVKLSRRTLLRKGAVMVGIAGPAAFVASCQPIPPPPPPAPPPVAQPAPPPLPPPPVKVSKVQAAYQNFPRGRQRCAVCVHFVPPNDCRVVQGPISPNGWSRYFEPRVPGPERG
jgi:hypothetical protein